MAVKNAVQAIPLLAINSSTLSGTYKPINAGGLPHACFLLVITNASTEDVFISYNGSTDHEYILQATRVQLPVQANAQPNNFTALFAQGTVVYARGTAGTGTIELSGYYLPSAG